MKFLMYAAMLAVIGCGVRAPVGQTRDLVSVQHRLYAHKVGDDRYCVFVQGKSDNAVQLLTPRGALSTRELKKAIRGEWRWKIFAAERKLREERLLALEIRDSCLAMSTKHLGKIVERIQAAEPSTTSCTATEQSPFEQSPFLQRWRIDIAELSTTSCAETD